MAKKAQTQTATTETTIAVPADFVSAYGDYSINADSLAAMGTKGVVYLLSNGFRQSMVDAAALSAKDKEGKTDAEVAEIVKEKRDARFAAILAGEVGTRVGGPRLSPLDSTIRDIAEREVTLQMEKHFAKDGKKLTSETRKELLKKYVPMHVERHGARIRQEAEEMLRKAESHADNVELDFVLDEPETAATESGESEAA